MAQALRPRLAEGRAEAATAEEFLSAFFSAVFALSAETGTGLARADLRSGCDDLRQDLDHAVARDLFRPLDTAALAAALLAAADEIAARLLSDGGDAAVATAAATRLFLAGVQPP